MSFAGDLRDVLRSSNFRRLFATRLSSQFADGVFQVALTSLFFFSPERQTTAGGVALAFTVLLLPYSVVGPFAGVLLDRWRRRQILVRANLLRSAMVVGVAALILGGVDGPVLYLAVLACLSVNRFLLAGLSASLPHVVPRHELVMANAVSPTSGTVAALLGGGAAYGLTLVLGDGDAADARIALVSAALYLAAALVATSMHPDLLGPDLDDEPPPAREAVRHVVSGFLAGARHLRTHPPAAHALAAIAAARFCYGTSTIIVILLHRNHFADPGDVDAGLAGLAVAVTASGAGMFAAALVTPWVTDRVSKQAWVTTCFAGAGLVEAVFVVHVSEGLVVAAAFLLGLAAQGSKICVDTLLQESVDDAYRGRVFSLYDVVFNVAFVAAAAFTAASVPASGTSRPVFALVALGYVATALAYLRATRRLSGGSRATSAAPPPPPPGEAAPGPDAARAGAGTPPPPAGPGARPGSA